MFHGSQEGSSLTADHEQARQSVLARICSFKTKTVEQLVYIFVPKHIGTTIYKSIKATLDFIIEHFPCQIKLDLTRLVYTCQTVLVFVNFFNAHM